MIFWPFLVGLPAITPDAFNIIAAGLDTKTVLVWSDTNQNGKVEPTELQDPSGKYVLTSGDGKNFTVAFHTLYRNALEQYRRNLVAHELTLSFRAPITTNIAEYLRSAPKDVGVTTAEIPAYQAGLRALLATRPIMQKLYDAQMGYNERMLQRVTLTADDKELLSRYGHPWCAGNQSAACVALASFPPRFHGPVISADACDRELDKSLTGLRNPYSVLTRGADGKLQTIPNATYFKSDLSDAAKNLRVAASEFAKIPREDALAKYLNATADAFENTAPFPQAAADAAWTEHSKSASILFVRVGADETDNDLGDACGVRAHYHINVGVKNFRASANTQKYAPYVQAWEERIAQLIGHPEWYAAQQIKIHMPEFIDVMFQAGDDLGNANGTTIGQTLPNWCGADGTGENCEHRTMSYVNKEAGAYNPQFVAKFIGPLFAPENRGDLTANVEYDSAVLHEITHNLGPNQGRAKPGSAVSYGASLGRFAGAMEELKAQTGAIDLPGVLVQSARDDAKSGKISAADLQKQEQWYRTSIMRDLAWAVRMVMRATRNGKFEGNAYSKLAAVQLGILSEQGAIVWNAQNQYWRVDFEKMPAATMALNQIILQNYAENDPKKVEAMFLKYIDATHDGFPLLHVDRIQTIAGKMPSVVYDYAVKM